MFNVQFIQNWKRNIFAIFHFLCNDNGSTVWITVIRLAAAMEFVHTTENIRKTKFINTILHVKMSFPLTEFWLSYEAKVEKKTKNQKPNWSVKSRPIIYHLPLTNSLEHSPLCRNPSI